MRVLLYVAMSFKFFIVSCFWPPEFNADLKQHEDFIISADASLSEDDDEMLKDNDIASLHLNMDSSKLEYLHRYFKYNTIPSLVEEKVKVPIKNEFKDIENLLPHIWKRTLNTSLQINKTMNYSHLNQTLFKEFSNKSSGEANEQYVDEEGVHEIIYPSTPKPPKQYDYDSFHADYYNEAEQALHSNISYNYTEKGKYEETIGDAVDEIISFEKPKNCSKEEDRNFGFKSFQCLWEDFKYSHKRMSKTKFLGRITKVLAAWFLIYVVIAIPCWCKYGLCCCCCWCNFCRPKRLMNKAKKYVAINPPGIFVEGGVEKQYEPTIYEIEIYNKLMRSIKKL